MEIKKRTACFGPAKNVGLLSALFPKNAESRPRATTDTWADHSAVTNPAVRWYLSLSLSIIGLLPLLVLTTACIRISMIDREREIYLGLLPALGLTTAQ